MTEDYQTATLGGGCFWCLEAIYNDLKGVLQVESGYSGGEISNPTYKQVSTGTTGHAEVIQIIFEPSRISYLDLLNVFFTIHDPTTLNRQGADLGTQYRSVIFYHDYAQKQIAEECIHQFNRNGIWENLIVTQVFPYKKFFKAEDYHQEYFVNNVNQPYCQAVIAPKVSKFRKTFIDQLKIS